MELVNFQLMLIWDDVFLVCICYYIYILLVYCYCFFLKNKVKQNYIKKNIYINN